jgi:hypothetical protein
MSVAGRASVARRPVLKGILGASGLAIVAIAALEAPRFFARRYAPTPFDDLFAQLPDRASAARLGAVILAGVKTFDADKTARKLRERLARRSLVAAIEDDLAGADIIEARGWVLPETLAELCALAAKAGS